jgi:LPS export ABC transporter protein LptC
MRNLARGILAVVAVFVVIVAVMLIARSRTARTESLGPAPSSADLRIKEVDLEEETKGVRWRLRAEQALMYDKEGRTTLKKLAVRVFERDRSWTIVGDEGDLFRKPRNVEVRGNVIVTSSDGFRLETSVLRWDADRQRLWTDAPVTLSRDDSVVHGTGLEVRMEEEETTVQGRVRAKFVRRDSR